MPGETIQQQAHWPGCVRLSLCNRPASQAFLPRLPALACLWHPGPGLPSGRRQLYASSEQHRASQPPAKPSLCGQNLLCELICQLLNIFSAPSCVPQGPTSSSEIPPETDSFVHPFHLSLAVMINIKARSLRENTPML
uniref:Uncharacterized protein n=1 Tax=Pipistrellus kuhlii TaxID=59472 RepID=A0A7J7YMS2_PIPKU|nr:hypothetical protein mPipKuh1_010115 [Pipistrellus kuhlii]